MGVFVSVIVPNYNHEKYLRNRIDTVLQQTYKQFEVIILDDYSTDHSKSVIEYYRNNPFISHIVYNNENSGSTFKQWNKGMSLAKGDLIWIAESDDSCENSFLEKTVRKMEEYPSAGIVYAQSLEVEETTGRQFLSFEGHPIFSRSFLQSYFQKGRKEVMDKMVHENTIPNASAVLFRKDIYTRCGGADEHMKLCGDWLLWTKMLFEADVCFIAEPLNYFRLTSMSARSRYSQEQTLHERLEVLNFIEEHRIPEAGKTKNKLIQKLFNSYKLSEIKTPVKLVIAQKGLVSRPKVKILRAIVLSLFARVIRKFPGTLSAP